MRSYTAKELDRRTGPLPPIPARFVREHHIFKSYVHYPRNGLPKLIPVFAYQYRREWSTV